MRRALSAYSVRPPFSSGKRCFGATIDWTTHCCWRQGICRASNRGTTGQHLCVACQERAACQGANPHLRRIDPRDQLHDVYRAIGREGARFCKESPRSANTFTPWVVLFYSVITFLQSAEPAKDQQ